MHCPTSFNLFIFHFFLISVDNALPNKICNACNVSPACSLPLPLTDALQMMRTIFATQVPTAKDEYHTQIARMHHNVAIKTSDELESIKSDHDYVKINLQNQREK
jgi:hypothetical protein